MEIGALAPYESALRTRGPLGLRTDDGRVVALDVVRWLAEADHSDDSVLTRVRGPVLDVGCGPGRFVSSLNRRGIAALGVDIAETAVALTRGQGLPALLRSVFSELPGEGRWPTVLLMDGNIGIGGDPLRLLERIRSLLAPGGTLIVETDPDRAADDLLEVRFTEGGQAVGPPFDWANVGRDALTCYAERCDYEIGELWSSEGRSFTVLVRPAVESRLLRATAIA